MVKNANENGGLYLGFLAGGVIGILAGLMFAPKSGKDLRSDIRERGYKFYGDTKQIISDTQWKTKSIIDDAMHRVDEFKKEAEQRLSEARLKACTAFSCASVEKAPLYPEEFAEDTGAEA